MRKGLLFPAYYCRTTTNYSGRTDERTNQNVEENHMSKTENIVC